MEVVPTLSQQVASSIVEAAREKGLVGEVELDVKLGSSEGDNNLGVVYSVKATERDAIGGCREAHFILKMMHSDVVARDALQNTELFANEIRFYTQILPAFRDFQHRRSTGGDLLGFAPRCFAAGGEAGGEFILMEDMKESGFKMGDRRKGMDRNEMALTMRSMGRFHAFSYAMKELEPEVFQELSEGIRHPFFVTEKKEIFRETFQRIAVTALEAVRIHSPESAKHLERWVSRGFINSVTEVCEMRDPLSVINHGDVWMNNVLFRGSPAEDIAIIDYQLIQYHSPAIDLLYTLYSSLKKGTRDEIFEDMLLEYHDALRSTLRDLGGRDDILPMAILMEHFKKYAMYGLGLCIFLIPIFYGEVVDEIVCVGVGDSKDNMEQNHRVHLRDEKIQLMVKDLVDEFVQRGYFKE